MKNTRFFALLLLAALCLGLAACGAAGSGSTSASTAQSAAPLTWYTEPTLTFDDIPCMVDDVPEYHVATAEEYRGLAFYEENGQCGIVGLAGEIIIPAEQDLGWCPICGIVTNGGHIAYYPGGTMYENIGHGGNDIYTVYLQNAQIPVDTSYGSLSEDIYDDGARYIPIMHCTPAFDPAKMSLADLASDENYQLDYSGGYKLLDESNTVAQTPDIAVVTPAATVTALHYTVNKSDYMARDSILHTNPACVQLADGTSTYLWLENGAVRTQGSWPNARAYHEGLAAVQNEKGQWGFIDENGATVIDFQFEDACDVMNGLVWVKQGGKWGVLQVAQPQYAEDYRTAATAPPVGGSPGAGAEIKFGDIPAGTTAPAGDKLFADVEFMQPADEAGLRLRTGPGTEYEKLLVIPYGETFSAFGTSADSEWLFAYYNGTYGWVSAEYTRGV